jgi:hypothetical protein
LLKHHNELTDGPVSYCCRMDVMVHAANQ